MPANPADPIALTRRRALRWSGAGLAMGALAASGVSMSTNAQSPTASEGVAFGLVDIGGRSIYMESAGAGSPTVVLIAGALSRGDIWSRDLLEPEGARTMVFPAVASFTHVLEYDRPGTIGPVNTSLEPNGPLFYPSRSDAVPQPRSGEEMVAELHNLLEAADVPGPYVLVGHSLGGLYARLYAMTYPDEVVGLVLVDATHEDGYAEFEKIMTPEQWAQFTGFLVINENLLAAYPEAEQPAGAPLADDHPTVKQVHAAMASSPLRPMPLFVLSHGIPLAAPFPGYPAEAAEAVMMALQDDLARLVPGAKHVIATESGHDIHQDQPELVIAAIRAVVDAVRNPSTWTSTA
ncbi:MAG TPA: alpha/beta hydrolase [Thermomicrobiales bacterium]|nr:alpha/beta hydrolase [Thermomicrobiales bacterium]